MNSFREFVISKLPLLVDDKLHIEAGEMFRLHEEWMSLDEVAEYGSIEMSAFIKSVRENTPKSNDDKTQTGQN